MRWLFVVLLLAGCASGPDVRPARAALVIDCRPDDATVYVDDRYAGTARVLRGRGIPLGPGTHRLQIERDGYFPYYGEVTLAGTRQVLRIDLVERPE